MLLVQFLSNLNYILFLFFFVFRQAHLRMKTPNKPDPQVKTSRTSTPVGSKRSLTSDMDDQWMVHKRSRLCAVSEPPQQSEMPLPAILGSPSVNSVFHKPTSQTVTVDNRTITELQPMMHVNQENIRQAQPEILTRNTNIKENRDENTKDTVTVCSMGMSETAAVKHTIQVRKDHQLPIQRLLKPEEYEAIRSSPKRRFPLSPIKPATQPRRIPFSPIRSTRNENNPIVKSKAQVALFTSPPSKNRQLTDCMSPARSQLPSSPMAASPSVHMTSTPNRRMSPRKFVQPSHSTPIRQSPCKHFSSSPLVKRHPLASGSPKKYHLYTTPSPVSSYRVQSPRKSSLFASRLANHASPLKRVSPVKLFSSPPTANVKIRSSPRKLPPPKDLLKQLTPVKAQPQGNSDTLMGALALIELSGGH